MMSPSPTPERLPPDPFPVSSFTGTINKTVFNINPHRTEDDLQAIQHEQHAPLAYGTGV